jgi:hypothetical protein
MTLVRMNLDESTMEDEKKHNQSRASLLIIMRHQGINTMADHHLSHTRK